MKFTTVIDKTREEEVFIYAHEKTKLVDEIEELCKGSEIEFIGYRDSEIIKFAPCDAQCFSIEDGKVIAILENDRLTMKARLYTIEENLGKDFVKINQSCIANLKKIKKFDASISGTLIVYFKNGHKDYVSRRQVKAIKERIGIK